MALFIPELIFGRITDITIERLRDMGVKALILDVDNTLTTHGSQKLDDDIAIWLQSMSANGIKLMIASNNTKKRIEPFAAKIGLEYTAFCIKPLPFGLARAQKAMGADKSQLALVGDQIYTDTLAAHFFGIPMLMVEPICKDYVWTIRAKRWLEKPFISRYYKKGGSLISLANNERR